MNVKIGLGAFLICGAVFSVVCVTSVVAEETLWTSSREPFSWTSYADVTGGTALVGGAVAPVLDGASGFYVDPEWTLGGFAAVIPLSNFQHTSLGLTIANQEAAYATMSGTEVWFTPFRQSLIHPLAGIRVGGLTAGRLIDIDGKEGYEGSTGDRTFFASFHAGAEANLTNWLRLTMRGGWRVATNSAFLGVDAGALRGPELSVGLRLIWTTTLR